MPPAVKKQTQSAQGPVNQGILVKKADGSTVRVSFDEFKRLRENISRKQPAEQVVEPPAIPKKRSEKVAKKVKDFAEKEQISSIKGQRIARKRPGLLQKKRAVAPPQPVQKKIEDQVKTKMPLSDPRIIRARKTKTVVSKPKISAPKLTKKDSLPLLHEKLEEQDLIERDLSDITTHDHIVDEVVQEFPMSIAPELQMRMRSLIVSFLRGVRDKHQFHEYAIQAAGSGGIGLTDEQASRLVLVIEKNRKEYESGKIEKTKSQAKKAVLSSRLKARGVPVKPVSAYKPETKKIQKQNPSKIQKALVKEPIDDLATTTPLVDSFIDQAIAKKQAEKVNVVKKEPTIEEQKPEARNIDLVEAVKNIQSRPTTPTIKTSVVNQKKTNKLVHDVSHIRTEHKTVGPQEEMLRYAKIDFNRLASDPEHAARRLIAKFNGWKEESFMMYLQARAAWFKSPLYKQFQDSALKAINKRLTIKKTVEGSKDLGLSLPEFLAILEVNKALAL